MPTQLQLQPQLRGSTQGGGKGAEAKPPLSAPAQAPARQARALPWVVRGFLVAHSLLESPRSGQHLTARLPQDCPNWGKIKRSAWKDSVLGKKWNFLLCSFCPFTMAVPAAPGCPQASGRPCGGEATGIFAQETSGLLKAPPPEGPSHPVIGANALVTQGDHFEGKYTDLEV